MQPDDKEKKPPKSYLNRARGYLYSGKVTIKPKPRVPLHPHDIEVPHGWEEHKNVVSPTVSKKLPPSSFVRKFFVGSVVFFIGALVFAGFTFLRGSNTFSNRNIDLVIVAKPFVDGGEELPVRVDITNRNPVALELADLVFVYTQSSSEDEEPVRIRQSLGTISSGSTVSRDFPIRLFGEESSERLIVAGLEYRVQGSNAIFEKETEYLVTIRSTPITLVLLVPDATFPNQEVEVEAKVTSNAAQPLDGLMLKMIYPTGFEFESSSPEPSFANNVWLLPALDPATEKSITLSGIMRGPPGEERIFRAEVGSQSDRDERELGVIYNAMLSPIEIRSSFVEAKLFVGGSSTDPAAVRSETKQDIRISYRNTLPTNVRDVTIVVHLDGELLDLASIGGGGGFYDSRERTITWNKTSVGNLKLLAPGAGGDLRFSFVSKPLSRETSLRPEVVFTTDVRGIDIAAGDIVRTATGVDEKKVRFITNLSFTKKTLYHSGPITNTGPIPPRVDQETTYTIVWGFTNTANEVRDAEVRTVLPTGVTWRNVVSPRSEEIHWSSETREIIWRVGTVPASSGFEIPSKEIAFQVSIQPSITQQNKDIDLTGKIVATGRDVFSGSELRITRDEHSTRLLGDTSSIGASGRVQQ